MKKRTRERRPKPLPDRRPQWQRDLYDGWAFERRARELDRRRDHGHVRGRRNGSRRDWRRRIWRRAVRAMTVLALMRADDSLWAGHTQYFKYAFDVNDPYLYGSERRAFRRQYEYAA